MANRDIEQLRQDLDRHIELTNERFDTISAQFKQGEAQFTQLMSSITSLGTTLQGLEQNTKPLVEYARDVQGVVNVSKKVRWIGAVLIAIPLIGTTLNHAYESITTWLSSNSHHP